jgi:hypothetical protein
VNRIDQETGKRRGPTRAVEPFKKKKQLFRIVSYVSFCCMRRGRVLFRGFLVCFPSYACCVDLLCVLACVEVEVLVSGVEVRVIILPPNVNIGHCREE